MPGGMTSEYHEAVRRRKARRTLKTHGLVFLLAVGALALFNVLFWRGYAWFIWPLLAWGAMLAIHAATVFSVRRVGLDEARIHEILKTLQK